MKKCTYIIVGILAMVILGGGIANYEKWQGEQISILQNNDKTRREEMDALNADILELQNRLLALETGKVVEYDTNGYNYLAIGNSITTHAKCDYWWDERGMASTSKENDYVHLVSLYLKEYYKIQVTHIVNYASWEVQSNDRAETYELIDPYLSPEVDLLTVQLGENVNDLTMFSSDFEALILYLKSNCPNAEIMIIDDFWDNSDRRNIKQSVAENCGVTYVDLSEIREKAEYECGLGTIVYGDDGEEHVVEHSGVAEHPGDAGMKYIADAIINQIQK